MENNKSNKILGIISIIWGALVLIYEILKNTVLDNWYSDEYTKATLTQRTEAAEQLKLGFETMNNFINIAFIIGLIIIVVFLLINQKKRNSKIFSKETSNGVYFICFGLLLCILLKVNLISLILVTIGGFLLLKQK
jgi:hypothetical protein